MRLFYYMKTTLKGLIANGAVTLIFFILFPAILAGFMGVVQEMSSQSDLKLSGVNVEIIDKDKSERSNALKEFLAREELSEVLTLVEEKPEVEVIINKGYGESVEALNGGKLTLNKKTKDFVLSTNTLKVVLDNYHKALYVSLSGGDVSKLSGANGKPIINNILVDKPEKENNFEKMAASMFGFCVVMLLYGLLQAGYSDIALNLEKRVNAAPVTKLQYLLYDSAGLFAYSVILLGLYLIFFRVIGVAFKGNLLDLFIIVIMASGFILSITKAITSIFGPKIGKVISFVIFILPILGGEIFGLGANVIARMTPTHYINKVLNMYVLNGNLSGSGKWMAIIFVTSGFLFSIAIIIEAFKGRKRQCA